MNEKQAITDGLDAQSVLDCTIQDRLRGVASGVVASMTADAFRSPAHIASRRYGDDCLVLVIASICLDGVDSFRRRWWLNGLRVQADAVLAFLSSRYPLEARRDPDPLCGGGTH
ncbi:hypothetical protein LCM4573_26970 [Rhizobium sp. LCM 4573]|nr:hypothetical protein LCM4573_26970 [Rhizobium sp. LCM 4573]